MLSVKEVIVVEGRYDKNTLSQIVDAVIIETSGFGIFKGCVDPALVKHAYIPDVAGKERRKSAPSKEGKLGVEGMRPEVLLDALRRAGATIGGEAAEPHAARITKADMYKRGLSGGQGSRERRAALIRALDLPEKLSADALLDVLNAIMTREDFYAMDLD